jgi:hypothetical protein
MVRSSFEDFDQWEFVIGRRRRAPVCTENLIRIFRVTESAKLAR